MVHDSSMHSRMARRMVCQHTVLPREAAHVPFTTPRARWAPLAGFRRWLQICHLLAPQHRLAGELPLRLLSSNIGAQRADELSHVPGPDPTPSLHPKIFTTRGTPAVHSTRSSKEPLQTQSAIASVYSAFR